MAKKRRKRHRPSTPVNHPASVEAAAPQAKPAALFLHAPALPFSVYHGAVSKAAFVVTLIAFLGLAAFLTKGYFTRPVIHESNLIETILNLNGKQCPEDFFLIDPNQSIQRARLGDEEDAIYFRIESGQKGGFVIDAKALNLPGDADNFCVPILAYYQGAPSINYGFKNRGIQLAGKSSYKLVNMQMTPSLDSPNYFLSIPDMTHDKPSFEIPWDEADQFFFIIDADAPTDIYIAKITILEKNES